MFSEPTNMTSNKCDIFSKMITQNSAYMLGNHHYQFSRPEAGFLSRQNDNELIFHTQPSIYTGNTEKEQKQVHILLVEKEQNDRIAYLRSLDQKYLADFDLTILECESGSQGLASVEKYPIDCILLGNSISDMHKSEFLSRLKHIRKELAPPILSISDKNDSNQQDIELEFGVTDFLQKDSHGHYLNILPVCIKHILSHHYTLKQKYRTEAMYDSLMERIQAVSYVISLGDDERFIYLSPKAEEFGISTELWKIDAQSRFESMHEEDRSNIESFFRQSCQQKQPFCCDYRLRCSDGNFRWFHDSATFAIDRHNRTVFMQGILIDITRTKSMEDELTSLRYYMDTQIAVRTDEMVRRLKVIESCNESLSDQLDHLYQTNSQLQDIIDRNRATMNALDASIIVLSTDGWITDMTVDAQRLTGWELNSSILHKVDEVLPLSGEGFQSIEYALMTCIETEKKEVHFKKLSLKYLDGRMIFVDLKITPIFEDNLFNGYILILTPYSN